MKRAFVAVLLAPVLLVLASCSSATEEAELGSAEFAISLRQAIATDVARVTVTVSGSGFTQFSVNLAPSNGLWGGTIGDIPAGSSRSFLAQAYDSSNNRIFSGTASEVSVNVNATVQVAITLQQVTPPTPFMNEAPFIDSLVFASSTVRPGGTLALTSAAHDPNPGDTLSYAWSSMDGGTFTLADASSTTWTAPPSTGLKTLTVTVTDSRGLSSSIAVRVNVVPGGGNAQLSVSFNSSPLISQVSATLARLTIGQTTTVSVTASDPDNDTLSYSWSASCAGTWTAATSSSAQFTPTSLPTSACNNCNLTVTVLDGRAGSNSGVLSLCVANPPAPNPLNPVITRFYQSSGSAAAGQALTYEVWASSPEGSGLTFSWAANTGSLGPASSSASNSRITWTAPACAVANIPTTITATVTDAVGLKATNTFTVTGLPVCTSGLSAAASMSTARSGHTAVLLTNGKVLVAGGVISSSSAALASAELYDPALSTWTATAPMTTARQYHTATLLPNGKVLVSGGLNGGLVLPAAELYDPALSTWTATGSMATARYAHTATLLPSGKVLVSGGYGGTQFQTAEVYDPASGLWSATSSMSTARSGHTQTLLNNGKVLVSGGLTGSAYLTTAELYDPAAGTWSPAGYMSYARHVHTATLLPNGKVLVSGGYNGTSLPVTAELYDPASGSWSTTGSLAGRYNHTATALFPSGKVLVLGGTRSSSIAWADLFDPTAGSWSVASSMAQARQSHSATLLNSGKVLIAGGSSSTSSLATAELYTP